MFNRILVAVNQLDTGNAVLEEAIDLAKGMGAELVLLHVLSPSEHIFPSSGIFLTDGGYLDVSLYEAAIKSYEQTWQAYRKLYSDQLHALAKTAEAAQVKVEVVEALGQTGEMICEIARTRQVSLIMIGRRGLTGAKELLWGSVSNYVLHHAPCAVLVVQSPSVSGSATSAEHDAVVS